MAKLPEQNQITQAIYDHYSDHQPDSRRYHLGGSMIGDECDRKLWYSFRWVKRIYHDGRLLILFKRGHSEESILVNHLRNIGIQVSDIDLETGNQYQFSAYGGHFGCSLDGVATGIPGAEKTNHLLEFKTHNDKSFKELKDKGVMDSKPLHYAQMQVYMMLSGLERALYVAVNKNDDELYTQRIHLDKEYADKLLLKALRIISSETPPEKLTEKPDFYKCKFCDYQDLCHYDEVAQTNCRTCIHSTPELDSNGRWSCALHEIDIPEKSQRVGCENHLLIPQLIPFAKQIDSGVNDISGDMYIKYEYQDCQFINTSTLKSMNGIPCYSSQEIRSINKQLINDERLQSLRESFDGIIQS